MLRTWCSSASRARLLSETASLLTTKSNLYRVHQRKHDQLDWEKNQVLPNLFNSIYGRLDL